MNKNEVIKAVSYAGFYHRQNAEAVFMRINGMKFTEIARQQSRSNTAVRSALVSIAKRAGCDASIEGMKNAVSRFLFKGIASVVNERSERRMTSRSAIIAQICVIINSSAEVVTSNNVRWLSQLQH